MAQTVKVYLYDRSVRGRTVLYRYLGDDAWQIEDVHENEPLKPSLVLHEDALAAIAREASGVVPVSDATTEHLADARGVRDRLLTLIENAAPHAD